MTDTAVEPGSLRDLLRQDATGIDPLRALLNALDHAGRVQAFRALKGRDMAKLFAVCADAEPLSVKDLLPEDAEAGATYIWDGVNSLPTFRRFQKRFYWRDPDDATLAGYNHQSMSPVTGPGCFVARDAEPEAPGRLVFDYTLTPEVQPPAWPKVRPASKGIMSRLVYGNMHDYMRRVTGDVMVGRAYKHGKETSNYFVLVRAGRA